MPSVIAGTLALCATVLAACGGSGAEKQVLTLSVETAPGVVKLTLRR